MAKILVIDDVEPIRHTINLILSAQGHEIDEAENGDIGLKKIQAGEYDLVITDILMPEKDGTEILMKLRSDGSELPILAISGGGTNVSGDYTLRLAENYADDVLKKPFSKRDLSDIVDRLLLKGQGN